MASLIPAELLERKIAHLQRLMDDVDRDLARTPKLGWLALLAVPFGAIYGVKGALLAPISTVCLIAVVYYILGVRRKDYAMERDELQRDLNRRNPPSAPTNP